MSTTSVPRWSAVSVGNLEFDSHARHHLVVVADSGAAAHVADHSSVLPPASTVIGAGEIDAGLESARTGWRFLLVGAAAAVARIHARVLAAGAIDDEITIVVLDGDDGFCAGTREVFCVHCRTTTATGARIADTLICGGCGVEVVVYHHFSRRHHAYLGYRPDAEELP
ncbi:dimethylamine monooxygenase subunit DmmA family protein [Nocardia sp. A7]|uniref:dimethylamine monooxygenase subunit DmmA family protein n=1 Tax=Nocardia sp. A7 TaxID=2789274 RepID=UPI0039794CF1